MATPASASDAVPAVRWAFTHAPSHLRLWLVAALGVAADLYTKYWAFETLRYGESRVLVPNLCSLQISLNPGALFGLGAGFAPIFVGASVLALLFVLYLFMNTPATRWSMHIALGLVLAGAVGNLYDRATHSAFVAHVPDRGRDIGLLEGQTEAHVLLADYPHGGNLRRWPLPLGPGSGLQPVVRDFVKIEARIGSFTLWPWIFNIADALLVVGVALLLVNFWREHRHEQAAAAPPP